MRWGSYVIATPVPDIDLGTELGEGHARHIYPAIARLDHQIHQSYKCEETEDNFVQL
jgi:hypothetical protein